MSASERGRFAFAPGRCSRFIVVALGFLVASGAKCITIADDATISVNIENIGSTFLVSPGTTEFTNPNNCVTRNSADYVGAGYGQVIAGRLVDIQLQTFGSFAGSIVSGSVSVNGIQILSYNGPWSNFATKRSLLTGTELQRQSAGVDELLAAVEDNNPVTVCVGGGFSQQAAAGMSVRVDIIAQADVRR